MRCCLNKEARTEHNWRYTGSTSETPAHRCLHCSNFFDFRIRLTLSTLLLFILGFAGNISAADMAVPRERISINAGWRFRKGDPAGVGDQLSYAKLKEALLASAAGFEFGVTADASVDLGREVTYTQPGFDDSDWRQLDLPHDWGIEGSFDPYLAGETAKLPWFGIAWYRKHLPIGVEDRGRRFYLDIDGAMSYATVWCNGRFVGGWPYGYTSFRLDLTPYINVGSDNVLAIRLDNPNESARWYPGGGLYRNVWLVKTSPVHVAQWGTFVTTSKVDRVSGSVKINVQIENHTPVDQNVKVYTDLYRLVSKRGVTVRVADTKSKATYATIVAGRTTSLSQRMAVKSPKLWSTEKPNLYVALTRIADGNNKILDAYETTFGIRTFKFDANKGFFLNGKHVPLRGVCEHNDLGALGTAFNTRAMERKLEILKEMGANALRTAHNPPAPEVLELCDRLGILVIDEAFDGWRKAKKLNDYNLLFDDWAGRDLRALIRRDRNHPSVMMWSVGNEVIEQGSREGAKIASFLVGIVRKEDPSRPAMIASNNVGAAIKGFSRSFDVFGYNYLSSHYAKFHKINPTIPVIGSETSSAISSRGEYFFPFTDQEDGGKANFQMSSYDLYAPHWGNSPDVEFKNHDKFPFSSGEFVWTGFDYLGEPTPYSSNAIKLQNPTDPEERERMKHDLEASGKTPPPSRSSYFGIIDLAGFKKDRFYLYQAHWRPDLPMAHILPHWNWPNRVGEITPVHVYTSGDEGELFLNYQSLGRKKKGRYEYRLRWDDVKYAPGELRVVAYKGGRKWAESVVKTTGRAAKLHLQADRDTFAADGTDLVFVTVSIIDQAGLVVPNAKNTLSFEISGSAEIVATDNGDATDQSSFQSLEREAFNGLALVIIRAKPGVAGPITLRVNSKDLSPAEITILAVPAAPRFAREPIM
jgi:beta-galactosidase